MSEGIHLSDRYLECYDCKKLYKGDCPLHGPLLWIKDSAVRSRARASLPSGLYLMPSALGQGGLGVFAKNEIERRVIFGPYEGQIIPLMSSNYTIDKTFTWDVLGEDEVEHMIDGRDEQHSNWMRFVNCARQEREQNMVAFQYCGEIYFRTCKTIDPSTELLVWFHDKYVWRLKDVAFYMPGKGVKFRCSRCGLFFAGPSYLFKHKKFRCRAESVARVSDPINDVTTLCHSEKASLVRQDSEGPEQRNVIIQSAMFVTHQGTQTDEDILEAVLQQEKAIPHEEVDFLMSSPHVPSLSPQVLSPQVRSPKVLSPKVPPPQVPPLQVLSPRVTSPQVLLPQALSPTPQAVSGKATAPTVSSDCRQVASNVTYIIENRAPDGQEANVVIGKGVFSPTHNNRSTVRFPDGPDAVSSEGPRLGNVIYHSLNQSGVGVMHHPAQASSRSQEPVSSPEAVVPELNSSTERNPTISELRPQMSPTQRAPSHNAPPLHHEQVAYATSGTEALRSAGVPPVKSSVNIVARHVAPSANGPRPITSTPIYVSPVVGQVAQQSKLASATPIRISDQVVKNIINTILPLRPGNQFLPRGAQVNTVATTFAAVPVAHALQVQMPAQAARSAANATTVTLRAVTPDALPKQLNAIHVGMPVLVPRKPDRRASGGHAGEQVGEAGEARKTYPCEYCGKVFKYVSKLKEHEPTHTGEKPFQCKHCSKCFTQKGTLKDHLRLHSGEKPFKCEVCGESFTWKIQLRVHKSTHTGDEPYKCELCGKAFAVKQYLTVHQRSHPGYEKPFKCDQCDMGFTQKVHLVTHKRTHAKEHLKCQDCNKCFTQREHLETHRRLHTGEKPYKCRNCGECFAVNSDLILHSRKHTDDRPTRCPDCGKGFSRMAALTVHQRIHSGDKPFKCKECGKCFISNSRLMIHQRWHSSGGSDESDKTNGQSSAGEQAAHAHQCHTCGTCFAEMAPLLEHQRSHNVDKAPGNSEEASMSIEQAAVYGEGARKPRGAEPMPLEGSPVRVQPTPLQKEPAVPDCVDQTQQQASHMRETPMDVDETPVHHERTETCSGKVGQRKPLTEHVTANKKSEKIQGNSSTPHDVALNVKIPARGKASPAESEGKALTANTAGERQQIYSDQSSVSEETSAILDETESQCNSSEHAVKTEASKQRQRASCELAAVNGDSSEQESYVEMNLTCNSERVRRRVIPPCLKPQVLR